MRELYPHLSFADNETSLSWAARLSALHTRGPLRPFLGDLGIAPGDLATGKRHAVDRLCQVGGTLSEPVWHNTIAFVSKRSRSLRGETFSSEFMTDPETRFCPACLVQDEEERGMPSVLRRHRLLWRLAVVRVCPVHSLRMLDRRARLWEAPYHELGMIVPETGAELHALIEKTGQAERSPIQDYIADRLERQPGPAWLDGQTIEQAWRATEFLGAVMAFGPSKKASEMSGQDWDAAAACGWEAVKEGADGVRGVLEVLVRDGRKTTSGVPHPRGTFGMLHAWLSASRQAKDPGPIRDLVRVCIRENFGLVPGQKVLGDPVDQPLFSTPAAAAKAAHVDARTLQNVLGSLGVKPAKTFRVGHGSRDLELYYYQQVRAVCAAMHRSVPVVLLPEVLGASRPMVSELIETGFVGLLAGPGRTESKMGRAADGLDVEAVKSLVASFPEAESTLALVTLAKAAEKTHHSLHVILPAVLGGLVVEVSRQPGKQGLKDVLVNVEALREALYIATPGMSPSVALHMLGFPKAVATEQVASLSEHAPLKAIQFIDRPWITPGEMSRFRSRYVLLDRLPSETGRTKSDIEAIMSGHDLVPVVDPERAGAILLRRSELPSDLWI